VSWLDIARGIDALEVAELDAALVAAMQARRASAGQLPRPDIQAFLPARPGRGRSAWPAVVTGGECKLQCDRQAKILEPMIGAHARRFGGS
jgi:hypothetical protein